MENPANPLEDQDWDDDDDPLVGPSGVRITADTSMFLSGVWKGSTLIANAVGKTPLHCRQTSDDEPDKSHPAYSLLVYESVKFSDTRSALSAFELKRTLTHHAILRGGGYAYIQRNAASEVESLIPLVPDRTYACRVDGKLWYVTSIGGPFEDDRFEIRRLRPEDVLHIHGLGYDGLGGYPLLKFAASAFGLALSQQHYAKSYFDNAATPRIVLEAEKEMGDRAYARLERSWARMKSGLQNAHRTAILEEGVKAHTLSFNAKESQLVEATKLSFTHIANFLNLPVHKVGGDGRTSYNSLTEENQSVLDEAIDPWLETWESECFCKLLTEEQKRAKSHEFVFDRRALVRTDLSKRAAFFRTAVGGPFLERDEARKELGYPVKGAGMLVPKNMSDPANPTVHDEPATDDEPADDSTRNASPPAFDREATVELCRDTIRRLAKRVAKATEKDSAAVDAGTAERQFLLDALDPVSRIAGDCTPTNLADLLRSVVDLERQSGATVDIIANRVADIVVGTYLTEEPEA